MSTRALIAALALGAGALIAALIFFPNLMISPGRLKPVHEFLNKDCLACHTPFQGPSPSKCLSCHAGIMSDVASKHSFRHRPDATTCFMCHSDHEGMRFYRPGVLSRE